MSEFDKFDLMIEKYNSITSNSRQVDDIIDKLTNNPFKQETNRPDCFSVNELRELPLYFIEGYKDKRVNKYIIPASKGTYYVTEKYLISELINFTYEASILENGYGDFTHSYNGIYLTVYRDTRPTNPLKDIFRFEPEEEQLMNRVYAECIQRNINCSIDAMQREIIAFSNAYEVSKIIEKNKQQIYEEENNKRTKQINELRNREEYYINDDNEKIKLLDEDEFF